MAKSTTFQNVEAAQTGQFEGYYLWSDLKNWSNGAPANGDTVNLGSYTGIVVCDLQGLSNISTLSNTNTTGEFATLNITTKITIGTVFNSPNTRTSFDVYGELIDNSSSNAGGWFAGNYYGIDGGEVVIAAPPTAEYEFFLGGTLAFEHPSATNPAQILGVAGLKETLELPGTVVKDVLISPSGSGLTVDTDAGTYVFTNFHASPTLNYQTSYDSTLGLASITFLPSTAPQQSKAQTSGPLANQYVWSNPVNWSNSPPGNGVNLTASSTGVDDIASLSLDDLTLSGSSTHVFVAGSLTIQLLTLAANTHIDADSYTGLALSSQLVIDGLSGTGGYIGANGWNAITDILGSSDAGENYSVSYGGALILNYALSASSSFSYASSRGWLALYNPGASTSAAINGVRAGDILELPGTSVSSLSLTGTDLKVTTDTASYDFSSFYLSANVTAYKSYFDSGLGLVAIRFLGPVHGDFNGSGAADILLQNSAGAVVVGELQNGVESYSTVAALGSEWSFEATGDFLGDGHEGFLISNTSGAVVVGEVASGATYYTRVAALGAEWKFVGAGDFFGLGQDQFLIENSAGAVVVANAASGAAQYTLVASLGSEWSFRGTGEFLGDGKTGFLIENMSGAVDVGEVSNGTTTYTQVASLGAEWKFVGSGDFLGNGQDQFLIENSSGAVDVANVVSGQAQYTQVAALGTEWSFLGTGDYLGTGTAGFTIENTAGAVVLGTVVNSQASYTKVSALGTEWTSHA
jgi:hypothetical protein